MYYLCTRSSACMVIVKGVNLSGVKILVFVIAEYGLHIVSEVLVECFTNLCTT